MIPSRYENSKYPASADPTAKPSSPEAGQKKISKTSSNSAIFLLALTLRKFPPAHTILCIPVFFIPFLIQFTTKCSNQFCAPAAI